MSKFDDGDESGWSSNWSEDEKSGYKKPPKRTQFKKGQSGNPAGRKRKTVTFDEILLDELAKQLKVTIDGRATKMTKQRVIAKNVVTAALKNETWAINLIHKAMGKNAEKQPKSYLHNAMKIVLVDGTVQRKL